jgi:tRNA(Leu) C34 or U34 (ribose-2'-O)-methylase TrmL
MQADRRGYAAIGLHQPKNILNMGEIMRAAGCYGVSLVAISGRRFKRSSIDTQQAWKHMPTIEVPDLFAAAPFGAVPVAVEFIPTATPLPDFVHPERAYYLLGPTVARCPHVVYVPTRHCMNLAATANVLLYDRLMKRQAQGVERERMQRATARYEFCRNAGAWESEAVLDTLTPEEFDARVDQAIKARAIELAAVRKQK